MSTNEIRKDYLLDRWSIISPQRKKRPYDMVKKSEEKKVGTCPFCPGNEHMTPPATLVYVQTDSGIKKEKDDAGTVHKNWLVRCFPNLYPALSPPPVEMKKQEGKADFTRVDAFGHHEVLLESPNHDEHPGIARISQLIHAIDAALDRLRDFSRDPYVKFTLIFRNHGIDAGASLSHPHMQLAATPMIPRTIKEELDACEKIWREKKVCVFCDIIKKESKGPRFIWQNKSFLIFAPWASINPYEFWIFPKIHQPTPLNMTNEQKSDLAEALKVSLGGLRNLLNDPPYNFGFHIAPTQGIFDHYHWHIEVYPKIAIWAGFEKSLAMYINTIQPEDAAENMRGIIQK
jgi:UDPglucose--hexose-1-phosphate uridylyltransferase